MNKFLLCLLFIFLELYLASSIENIKYINVKRIIDNSSDLEIKEYFNGIKNKKIDWAGCIISIKNHDATNDIIYVDMDNTKGNPKLDFPDLYFYIDKKISKRLAEYQCVYFIAVIEGIDYFDKKYLIKVSNVFLRGIMK